VSVNLITGYLNQALIGPLNQTNLHQLDNIHMDILVVSPEGLGQGTNACGSRLAKLLEQLKAAWCEYSQ
jgi:hypothetical protein